MKKIFKKLSASIFALSIFANTHSTWAMNPSLTLSEKTSKSLREQNANYLNEQIKEFENLAPGIFSVDPELKEPTKSNTEITSKTLNQMIKIFRKYPNLTQKFIKQTQITKNKRLEIKLLDPDRDIAKSIYNIAACSAYYIDTDAVKIYIDAHRLYEIESNSSLKFWALISCGMPIDDYITYNITHEMGHLISSLIAFCRDTQFFINFLPTATLLRNQLHILNEKLSKGEEVKKITEYLKSIKPHVDRANKTYDNFRQEIIDIAKTKCGYVGNGFITEYGKTNSNEWLSEVFADALCSRSPGPLGLAMRDWLDKYEKALSNSGFPRTAACTLL